MEEGSAKKSWLIGIDLGTANTRVAVFRNDKVEIIPDVDGSLSMPSCVSFTDRGRLIGSATRSQHAANPTNTFFDIKRLVGRSFDEPEVQTMPEHFPFKVFQDGHRWWNTVIETEFMGSTLTLTVVEVLSMILSGAKENAETYLDGLVEDAVISIPTYWFLEQRNVILDAAEIAGISVKHLMPGPYAVTTTYTQFLSRNSGERNILVVDLGAGMCNTAVATIEEGIVEIRSVAGDMHLGGEDFVSRLVNHMLKEAGRKWKEEDLAMHRRGLRRLRTACEVAIRELSSASRAYVEVDSLYEGRDFCSFVDRSRFEELCLDLFQGIVPPIERALVDARIDKSAVHEIIVTGGSVRIPKIQKILEDYFNGKTINKAMHPDEAEVTGLAIHAAIWQGDLGPSHAELLLMEALPLSIGVETVGGIMRKLVPRNTTLPTKKSELLVFYDNIESLTRDNIPPPHMRERHTNADNLVQIVGPDICFYEGERQRTKDNRLLQKITIPQYLVLRGGGTEVECTIDIEPRHYRAWVVLEEKSAMRKIKARLDGIHRLDPKLVDLMKEDAARYKALDDIEADRVEARDALERRIAALAESFEQIMGHGHGKIFDSPEVAAIRPSLLKASDWAEENPLATSEEYLEQARHHDDVETSIRALRELDDTEPIGDPGVNSSNDVTQVPAVADNQSGENHKSQGSTFVDDTTPSFQHLQSYPRSRSPPQRQPPKTEPPPDPETLESLFSRSRDGLNDPFTDAQFERISTFLRNNNKLPAAWSAVPRLYTVLRLIDQLDAMDVFLAQGMTDIWFPFTAVTLPSAFPPRHQSTFLETQAVVLSKGFKLEKATDRKHALFSAGEQVPFQTIGRLGRGAHGSVDKVMSTISHREYARKTFRKRKGLRQEDISTFKTELDLLKRVQHWHCVELIGSYTDPRHFALIMQPVGEYNLADYYHKARDNSDMLSFSGASLAASPTRCSTSMARASATVISSRRTSSSNVTGSCLPTLASPTAGRT